MHTTVPCPRPLPLIVGIFSWPGGCDIPILPTLPASSPWVTAVGAVMHSRTHPGAKPSLVACSAGGGSLVTSSGGFGFYNDAHSPGLPSWQKAVVTAYINAHKGDPTWPLQPSLNPYANVSFNSSTGGGATTYGRGFPDIALVGMNVAVVASGQPLMVFGTSITAPTMAGLVAQINGAIRATPGLHKKKIGFMTPFLYWAAKKYPTAFHDITVGYSGYNEANATRCPLGYSAAVGWDAVTGLGVPNIKVLQKAAIKYVKLQIKANQRQ